MTFLPAPANTGLRFRRVDLEGKPEIEARIENVSDTTRSTTLCKGNVRIHTVEHVLATLAGFGIDNAIIELDANEPPIGDGSAKAYCKMVQTAGLVLQGERRNFFHLEKPVQLEVGETSMAAFPHEHLKISCTSSDRQGRFTQYFTIELTPENWEREVSAARTFCFFDEIEYLIKNGLIKGGSLENAVVIRDDAVLTNEPLRYPEEFVRHKILDIIGDMALVGRPLCAHIVAIKPSHAVNCELARKLTALERNPLGGARPFAPPPAEAAGGGEGKIEPDPTAMDIQELLRVLPHRYPFLMVDRVTRIEGNTITALKNVTFNEPYFQGHFPNHPIMPGVLQLEAMAQVAGLLMLKQAENAGKLAYFMSAEAVKWRKPVRPGDSLLIKVELVKSRGKIGKARGVCSVNGEVVSEADVAFMLIDG
jgi:UDP-3-O-[3-hydroxymyristoyl] N-acetylglucosamine deacetylase/3-hydroxyacyl-[acyl-carrier-protein] dehydratase